MESSEIKKIYSRYSPVYDAIFSSMFFPRIRLGLEKIGIEKGDRIIEVGIGTGISLPLYPDACRVVGIDITRKMLEKAKKKKDKFGLEHVDLLEMDAENITFSDDSFDHAVVPFVVSVVSNPEKMVSEIKRVTKKNGKIIIINHFCSKRSFFSKIEKIFTPLFLKLGWKGGVSVDLLSNHCHLQIEEISKKHKLDPWVVVHATNNK